MSVLSPDPVEVARRHAALWFRWGVPVLVLIIATAAVVFL